MREHSKGFQTGSCSQSWIFEIQFLTVGAVKRPILHQRNKFRKDQSNRCGNIAIFVIFKMAAAAILHFQKFEILTVDPPQNLLPMQHISDSDPEVRKVPEVNATHTDPSPIFVRINRGDHHGLI